MKRFTFKLGKRRIVVHEPDALLAARARDRIIELYFPDTKPEQWTLKEVASS